jgi:hypothetical protein
MRCNSRTMLTVGLAMGLAAAIAYFTLPAAQAFILASAPVLLALICPISMLFMMKAMHGSKKNQAVEPKPAPPLGDADQA